MTRVFERLSPSPRGGGTGRGWQAFTKRSQSASRSRSAFIFTFHFSLFTFLLLASCVAEKSRPRGISVPRSPTERQVADARANAANAPIELPKGPVASPVAGATTVSRIQVEMAPLGSVPYDGQVLPLTSPDGRFIATQEGEAPAWPALLAQDHASPPGGTRLGVFNVGDKGVSRLAFADPLPPGLILGRAADDDGFLVESPRLDASRWIGKVSWIGGRLTWLVQGGDVNAHAVFTSNGSLLFTRRALARASSALVLRRPDGSEHAIDDPAYAFVFPLATRDPSAVYALGLGESSIALLAVRLATDGGPTSAARLGSIIGRREVARGTDLVVAHQIAAAAQCTAPFPAAGASVASAGEPPVLFVPSLGRMAVYDLAANALLTLAPNSIAAARYVDARSRGYFCTTPKGLVYCPEPRAGDASDATRRVDAEIVSAPFVPRLTTDPKRGVLLFGPARNDPASLQVLALQPLTN